MAEPLGVELQELKKRFTRGDQDVTMLDVTVSVPPGDFVAVDPLFHCFALLDIVEHVEGSS